MITLQDGQFYRDEKALQVYAKTTRGRWQYRTQDGKLIASGMSPKSFVSSFWFSELVEAGA